MFKIKLCHHKKKVSYKSLYNYNQRTASGRGLCTLRLCVFKGENFTGGVGSQRDGLSGVSSLTIYIALNYLMALTLGNTYQVVDNVHSFGNTDYPLVQILFGDAMCR